MWQQRLNLGTYFGIAVYVHWSFALLVAYVGYAGYQDGLLGTLFGIAVLGGMFFCVTLHEYGHALTARRFGIDTLDITLFPIGGVARLMKIPRVPWQEFLVAIAGPAVNVVILIVLFTAWWFLPEDWLPSPISILTNEVAEAKFAEASNSIGLMGYMIAMVAVNTVLILFNFIPAFPMDGGRVLRSILAMALEYRRATRIAATIGVFCAILMGWVAIQFQAIPAGLIALFICYAGISEARHVDIVEPLRGFSVSQGMILDPPAVHFTTPLVDLVQRIRSIPLECIPVVDGAGYNIGVVTVADIAEALKNDADLSTTAGQLARHDVPVLPPDAPLESIISGLPTQFRQFPVTDPHGRLLGVLNLSSVRDRISLGPIGLPMEQVSPAEPELFI
ncbi:site-2 protease family protein [Rhodopirellula sp. MGV]|uniref:site-2 protease family protein n=1 Tax=Rhodopirellula sp. MGV TaxID=2023130 RepID=UPI000B96C51C|nr:site-2 protease family protein [Rhodopirellula sp. MGV]OYP36568.1 hypothetical protein CGZ80_08025 [Rhodopirellula sp. MGV]PNY34544.1 CBS domain-containing protein [Rhodopirellula baltica]